MRIGIRLGVDELISGKMTGRIAIENENKVTLEYGQFVIDELKKAGYDVLVYGNTKKEYNCLIDAIKGEIEKASKDNLDWFINLQCNFGIKTGVRCSVTPDSDRVAANCAYQMGCKAQEILRIPNQGIMSNHAEPYSKEIPGTHSVCFNAFFVDNYFDCQGFEIAGAEKLGTEIGKEIIKYLEDNKNE